MEIKQFYDINLAHASYAVLCDNKIALIDPARDPEQYYDFAKENNAEIIAVIETHPHADFVSSHLEISDKTGAKIYISKLVNPEYDFVPFDEGDELKIGKATLTAINTPGHSPDSISILIKDEEGIDQAIATGDTLFVGDVGRPDLRETAGSINKSREELASMMYNTINEKLKNLPESLIVYPAHGAGSLCGKSTNTDTYSTIGRELKENYALQPMSEEKFVNELLKDQSYIPKYFGYNVELNRNGAPDFKDSINKVRRLKSYEDIEKGFTVVDTRNENEFKAGHLLNAINIPEDKRFETYLGTIISPDEKFYVVSGSEEDSERIIRRAAKIGYELNIKGTIVYEENSESVKSPETDLEKFNQNKDQYTILDVRNNTERKENCIFDESYFIPFNELRDRIDEIPKGKPVMVHCAAGLRSAISSSILENSINEKVYDLSENIKKFI